MIIDFEDITEYGDFTDPIATQCAVIANSLWRQHPTRELESFINWLEDEMNCKITLATDGKNKYFAQLEVDEIDYVFFVLKYTS